MTEPQGTSERDRPLRVAVVNDYEIVVKGLEAMLEPYDDRIVVVETETKGIPSGSADIALFDTFAGHRSSLERIERMVEDRDLTKVVLYTWDVEGDFADAARAHDVDAVICKSATGAILVDLLERVYSGELVVTDLEGRRVDNPDVVVRNGEGQLVNALSEREREVLAVLSDGKSNKEIAAELYLSPETIKSHVRSILAKLDVKNRTEAALRARDFGIVRRDPGD